MTICNTYHKNKSNDASEEAEVASTMYISGCTASMYSLTTPLICNDSWCPCNAWWKKLIKLRTGFPSPWGHVLQMKHDWKLYKRRNYIEDWNKITMLYSYTFLITNTCWYYYGDYSNTHTNSLNTNAFFYSALLSTTNYVLFFFYLLWMMNKNSS